MRVEQELEVSMYEKTLTALRAQLAAAKDSAGVLTRKHLC
jgi:hypothetical protein